MGLFTNKKKGKAPHTWYPDILHWREGDRINCWNLYSVMEKKNFDHATFHRYMDPASGGYGKGMFTYKSVSENGKIYLEDDEGHLLEFEFYRFIKKSRNESLKSRMIESKVRDSKKYMELMENFQLAFNELQEADNHPHRLGEPKKDNS